MANKALFIIIPIIVFGIGMAFLFVPPEVSTTDITPDEAKQIAEKAFIYAYPMLENYHTMYYNAVDDSSDKYLKPFNQIHNADKLATPETTFFVSPNSDTLYSIIWFDLRAEPVILSVPAIEKERYYTFQLVDYYTNNFGYIGTRTEGNDGGSFEIYIQTDSTGDDKKSNWLPAPDGGFYSPIRTYLPEKALLDGTWEYPEIVVTPKSS